MNLCQKLAAEQGTVAIAIDTHEDGTVDLKKLMRTRSDPMSVMEAAKRPSPAASKCLVWEEPQSDMRNARLWRSHLVALKFIEGQKNTIIATALSRQQVHSAASTSLHYCIVSLQASTGQSYDHMTLHVATYLSLKPLWRELAKADGTELLEDVKERAYQSFRGTRATRSSRRAAFQQSSYSYKSTKFDGRFAAGTPLVWHAPQLEPLEDEVS